MTKNSDDTVVVYNNWAENYDLTRPPETYLEEPTVMNMMNIQSGEKVLDAACGTGRYSILFDKLGASVVGVDASLEMVQEARKKTTHQKIHWSTLDLEDDLPFKSLYFDKICLSLALKHVQEVDSLFKEFFRVLKPYGQCVVSATHDQVNWDHYAPAQNFPFVLSEMTSYFEYSKEDIIKFAELAGFESEYSMELCFDESTRSLLLPHSYEKLKGKPHMNVFLFRKP